MSQMNEARKETRRGGNEAAKKTRKCPIYTSYDEKFKRNELY